MRKLYFQGAITLTAGAMLLGASTRASALEIKSGNDKVDVQLKGHIARAMMMADDGNDSKFFHVDNSNSESRIILDGKVKASDSLTVGSTFEVQWQANPSDKVSMGEETISGEFKERIMEVYFDAKDMGKFSLGRGDMASDDSTEVDLSGTDLAGNSGVADVGGSFKFYDPAAEALVPDENGEVVDNRLAVSNVFDNMDGLSRRNRVRYDTPKFAGFGLGVSTGEKEMADVTLIYSGELSGTKLEGALAWSDPGSEKSYSQINGSASLLFDFGLNFTAAFGSRDVDNMPAGGDEPTFTYGKIGYKCDKLLPFGSTAVSVDYGAYENVKHQNKGEEGTAYGLQLVQKVSDWNTELYAAWRNFELEDNSGAGYEDISIVMAGVRLKF
ncbi:MAG: porin [Candidatus Electronema aureum]|uniref:Porin n=1 Tax=Candidatus Electronema aureum TaxID=2005002 RepID=A0A521G1U6_9BACT|nr:MAG: porin [Candidatus Electronema aureum]